MVRVACTMDDIWSNFNFSERREDSCVLKKFPNVNEKDEHTVHPYGYFT